MRILKVSCSVDKPRSHYKLRCYSRYGCMIPKASKWDHDCQSWLLIIISLVDVYLMLVGKKKICPNEHSMSNACFRDSTNSHDSLSPLISYISHCLFSNRRVTYYSVHHIKHSLAWFTTSGCMDQFWSSQLSCFSSVDSLSFRWGHKVRCLQLLFTANKKKCLLSVLYNVWTNTNAADYILLNQLPMRNKIVIVKTLLFFFLLKTC